MWLANDRLPHLHDSSTIFVFHYVLFFLSQTHFSLLLFYHMNKMKGSKRTFHVSFLLPFAFNEPLDPNDFTFSSDVCIDSISIFKYIHMFIRNAYILLKIPLLNFLKKDDHFLKRPPSVKGK